MKSNRNIVNNIIKSITLVFFFCIFDSTFATTELNVKLDSSDNGSYNNVSISEVTNYNTGLDFKIQAVIEPSDTGSYSINFPSGFENLSISNESNTGACTGYTPINLSNSNFSFNISSITELCVYNIYLKYKVTTSTTSGVKTISILDTINNTITHSLNVGIVNSNSITKAETIDLNSNGYIDQYKLTFSTGGLDVFSTGGLTVGTLIPELISSNNNIAYIGFNDSVYTTGEKPQIKDIDGNIFEGVGIIDTNTINEEDKSQPIVKSVNSTNVIGISNPEINIYENSKLSIVFSEKIYEDSISSSFIIKENGIILSSNSGELKFNENNGDTMYFCIDGYDTEGNCNTPFDSNKSYSIELGSLMIDLNENIYIGGAINANINVSDNTPPVGQEITFNSEVNNGILIKGNSGNNDYVNTSNGGIIELLIKGADNSNSLYEMCLSETSECTTWETYSETKNYTLNSNEGTKTFYVKFKDPSGNISNTYSDSIVWDNTTPTTNSSPDGAYFQNNTNNNISLNCSDSTSGCDKIYYTIDGSAPTLFSNSIVSGENISLDGIGETIKVKFFSVDNAENQEGLTNTKEFIFSDSFITIDNTTLFTNNTGVTLNGSCANSLGNNNVEYSLNNSENYIEVSCDSNNWFSDIILLENNENTIIARIKENNSIITNLTITHDNTYPSKPLVSINGGDNYSDSNTVTINASSTDSSGIDKICVSENSNLADFTEDCTDGTWIDYINPLNYSLTSSDGNKTLYIKVKDFAGNISEVNEKSIILESTNPIISSNISAGTYSFAISISLNTATGSIYYTLDGTTPDNTSLLYDSNLNLGSNEGSLTLKLIAYGNSGLNSGVQTYPFIFSCPTVSNGSISDYTSGCNLTCNSGYNKVDNSCIAPVSSGGGGGGGGSITSTCKDTQLECKQHSNGNYVWYRQENISCTGGSLGKVCENKKNTGTGKINTGTIDEVKENFLDINTNNSTLTLIQKLKSQTDNNTTHKLIDKYAKELISTEVDYYASFNSEIYSKYNTIVEGFTNFILKTDTYLNTKNIENQTEANIAYQDFLKIRGFESTFSNQYVNKNIKESKEVWETKHEPIKKVAGSLESKMLKKIKTLLDTETINERIYYKAIEDYNEFILHLTIYKIHNVKASAYRALTPGRAFLKIYKMNVIYKNIEESVVESIIIQEKQIILIKDKYSFPNELKFGDYNKDVQNLQEILKNYGYFNYSQTTMYFGIVTKSSLINFSNTILKINNKNGIFSKEIIEKIYLLEYKEY